AGTIRSPVQSPVQFSVQSQENTMRTQHNTATTWRRWLFFALAVVAWAALTLTLALTHPDPASAAAGAIRYQIAPPILLPVSDRTGGTFLITGVAHLCLMRP